MRLRRAGVLAAGLLLVAVTLPGCETLGYYTQALRGQTELWRASRSMSEVMADPQSSDALKARLELASRIREFASRELGLPDNGSYRAYADLKRSYVVWNVFSAETLSIKPKQWCFPFAGCVAYKGFFSKAQADALAEELARDGFDVFVSGVPAYSTLGYFNDPLLNTFIHYPPAELARLIFHELAHQVAYARDDTVFNESFAVAVEREGVRRWLARYGSQKDAQAYDQARARRTAFGELIRKYRGKLEDLYSSTQPAQSKLANKAVVFDELRSEYAQLKTSWGGFKGYDFWIGEHANNATIASIAVYTQQVPAFEALLAEAGGDLTRFYAEVRQLARSPKEEREERLKQVVASR
jgi:predicted aminopeptidase